MHSSSGREQSQAKGLDAGPRACHLPASLRTSEVIQGAVSEHKGSCRPPSRGQGTATWLQVMQGEGGMTEKVRKQTLWPWKLLGAGTEASSCSRMSPSFWL